MKKYKILLSFFILLLIILSTYFFLTKAPNKILRSLISKEHKDLILKYILPYRFISHQEQIISNLTPLSLEMKFKESLDEIVVLKNFTLSNGLFLERFNLVKGFYTGINNIIPGSGYIDFYENNIVILSSRGVLAYSNNLTNSNNLINKIIFKQIKNNINYFINSSQFKREKKFSLKDIMISKNKIYISYTEEIKNNCFNTGIIYGDMNYENIKFKKLFSPKECILSVNIDGINREFAPTQSGGRIVKFDDNHILLSIGEYRNRSLAQNKESINGKIIKINIQDSNYEIISMGHRNPQGLYFDKENNFILETEHGPNGGDEINLIEVERINKNNILNFGWAVVSAGEHYGEKSKNVEKYKKFPLYKSHSKYGFIEPLKSFVPSIAISEIVKIDKNKYVVASMKDKSLYFFELNDEKEIINLERVEILERIRDLKFYNNKLYLFLEDTASIGIINLN
tara:strand:+ start:725 stop:2092 length:1368 start_codon:yes stop_codon:yes gene_type:complete